jgi:hypothetical protein
MMEPNQMTKKILDFQKDVFSQWYDVLTSMQEQAATSLKSAMAQANWIPDEGRRMLQSWVDACQKGYDDYKELVEDSLSDLEKVLVIRSKKAAVSNKAPAAKRAGIKRTPRKAKTAATAKAETASIADASEDVVQPTASPQAVVMEKESTSVADMDETAK